MKLTARVAAISISLRAAAPSLLVDAAGIGGAGLIIRGAWLVYSPAGYLVAGIMLLAGAWLVARRG